MVLKTERVPPIPMFTGSCYLARVAATRRRHCSPGACGKIRLSHCTHGWVALCASGIISALPHLTIQQWKTYIYTLSIGLHFQWASCPPRAILRPDQLKRCREPDTFTANTLQVLFLIMLWYLSKSKLPCFEIRYWLFWCTHIFVLILKCFSINKRPLSSYH